jgi:predicted nucleic acid-binding protein
LKVLFDTNVILDVLLDRKPFVEISAKLVNLVENQKIEGYLCATTLTTLDYLITKALDRSHAKIAIQSLLTLFKVCEVNSTVLEMAINSKFNDFEDAVQYFSGECCHINALVTRNIKDYKHANLPVYLPNELWAMVGAENN